MWLRWLLTVFGLIPSRKAICLLATPAPRRARTSRSRSLMRLGRPAGAALLDERRGDARGERRRALRRGLDPREQLLGLGVLEQVAGRARVERVGDPPPVGERRQDDDARPVLAAADRARGLDAVHDRHLQVHEDDVGVAVRAAVDGLLAVARDAHDLDAVAGLEQAGDPDADDLVVVGDQDTDRPGLRGGEHTP